MTYQVSEATRQALIQAAGELFAERDVAAVSVRAITARAGVKVNAISYHFGGKEGLVDAVIGYALRHWDPQRYLAYYAQMESQLDSREGQRNTVIGLLKIYFDQVYPRNNPAWSRRFLLRLLYNNERERERIAAVVRQVPLELLGRLFQRITGCTDPEIAYCWFLNVVGASAIYGGNLLLHRPFRPGSEEDRVFYQKIRYWAIRNALQGLGLFDVKRDSQYPAFNESEPEKNV